MIATERIEVAFRTAITYELSHSYGPFAHTDPNIYSSWFLNVMKLVQPSPYNELMASIKKEEDRTKELFVKAFRAKYTSEQSLPIVARRLRAGDQARQG